jgi:D-glycero-alpha-D-manno-heptose 1-phosphate guanylyltransferase
MIREAIILAGGLGTRLRTAVPDLPKCMAPVAGKPFLEWLIGWLTVQGIGRVIFSLGYKHEVVDEFLRSRYKDLTYKIVVESDPLGTGGAIRKAVDVVREENVLVLNGDTFFKVDLAAMSGFHITKKGDCTLALKPMKNSDRYGVVEINNENAVTAFREKQWYDESLINGGVYALHVTPFIKMKFPEKFSFEKDYLEKNFPSGRIIGFVQDKYFIDIGVPEDFKKAGNELPLQND